MHMGFVPMPWYHLAPRPAGDPTVYGVDGMEIALRHETAAAIRMRSVDSESPENNEIPDLLEAAR